MRIQIEDENGNVLSVYERDCQPGVKTGDRISVGGLLRTVVETEMVSDQMFAVDTFFIIVS